jgi:hypothetical protein
MWPTASASCARWKQLRELRDTCRTKKARHRALRILNQLSEIAHLPPASKLRQRHVHGAHAGSFPSPIGAALRHRINQPSTQLHRVFACVPIVAVQTHLPSVTLGSRRESLYGQQALPTRTPNSNVHASIEAAHEKRIPTIS